MEKFFGNMDPYPLFLGLGTRWKHPFKLKYRLEAPVDHKYGKHWSIIRHFMNVGPDLKLGVN